MTDDPIEYVRAGLVLVPIPLGKKGPVTKGWDLEANAYRTEVQAARLIGGNTGLAHRWCGTCVLDADDVSLAGPWLAERGVDAQALLDAPDSVQIQSGRPNRFKLVYRLPQNVPWLPTHKLLKEAGIELRCANSDGAKTVQDVLPPSIHPETGAPYRWAGRGSWRHIPVLPDTVLKIWQALANPRLSEKEVITVHLPPAPVWVGVDAGEELLYPPAEEIEAVMSFIPNNDEDYDHWLRIGMALHSWSSHGLALWDAWSAKSSKHLRGETNRAWKSFKRRAGGGVTIATIFHEAKIHGWRSAPTQAPAPVIKLGSAEGGIFGEQAAVTLPNPPAPYIRTKDGRLGTEIEGQVEIWCDYDIYPVRRLRDVTLGADTLVLRCDKKMDGIVTLALPTAMIGNLKEFTTWLNQQGIYIGGKTVMKMQAYLMTYMKDLQARASHAQQYNQLGWKDDHTSFVLGHSVHRADGTSVDNTASGSVSTIHGFAKRGDLDTWRRVMSLYERGGMEPYQFAVGIGFAAPLMPFSGYEGAVVAMVSPEGGQGKTTALHAINSIWGNPKDIGLQANDTPNAVLKRIGAYNNMPVTLDEVSNTTGQQLSDLAYQITQGRERRRLNSDASEKPTLERWSTILAVTANQSLLARLALYKTNSDAEVHRIVEYMVQNPMTVSKDEAESHFPLLFEHYGTAGDIYARWLVQNVPAIKRALTVTRQKLDTAAGISTKERYWSAVSAAVITGVAIAKKLGLVGFDVQQLFNWTLGALASMRTKGADITRDTVSILAAYLNQFMGGRIVVKKSVGNSWTVLVDLRGTEMIYRVEQDTGRIYLDRTHFRNWLARSGGDYHSLLMDLRSSGVLTRADGKRSLGQGTNYTTAVTTCLEIDMTHPMLSAQPVLKVVESESTSTKEQTC